MKVTIAQNPAVDLRALLARAPKKERDSLKHLDLYIKASITTWAGSVNGEIACVWGLIPPSVLADRALLWLQITDLVWEHKFLFIRHSRIHLQRMLALYPIIVGTADPEFPENVKWLKWLGAEFGEPIPGGIPFTIRAK